MELANKCMRASRTVSVHAYDPPSVELLTIRLYDSAFCGVTDKKSGSGQSSIDQKPVVVLAPWCSRRADIIACAMGEALRLVVLLELHQESSFIGLSE